MGDEELTPRGLKGLALSRKLYDIIKFSVDMDIFSKTDQAMTPEMLARDIGVDGLFLELLLGVLENAGFVGSNILDGTRSFMNTSVSRTYLSRNSPYFIGGDIFNDADTYDILSAYVKVGPPDDGIDQSFWTAEFVSTIGSKSLMGPLQETLESVDLTGRKKLLDVGGGHGLYSIFFTRRYPQLEAWVLDLPAIIPIARGYIQKFGTSDRVHLIACALEDFTNAEKYDVVFASNYAGSRDSLWDMVSRSRSLLDDNGWLIIRSYARDVKDDAASALVLLDRYVRRGHPGLASTDYISAMEARGFAGIMELYRGNGVIILKGKKDR
jgi:precorrin-6B methylase 2